MRLCHRHAKRWRKYGDFNVNLTHRGEPLLQRFFRQITFSTSGCWLWTGTPSQKYGLFKIDGRMIYAHRWSYEQRYGPVPAGRQLDHFVCDTPRCCNPDHMRHVTARENNLRSNAPSAWNAGREECKRGHAFTDENTRYANGRRICRTCAREHMRRYRAAAR